MIKIALVEDDEHYREKLSGFLKRYEEETKEKLSVSVFSDGLDITEESREVFDIIFLDIQMRHMDGMTAAEKIRDRDKNVILIFITNLAQYAIRGYKVEAMDYLLKPVSYFVFSQELEKAMEKVRERTASYISIAQENGMARIDVSHITYIESQGHAITYHTKKEELQVRDSLKNIEQKLAGKGFSRCNNCYLVNLAYVEKVDKNTVTVFGKELAVSRPRKKDFMEALADFMGGN